jgi:cbb3-type cytochrome oxidase subunit 3
LGPDQSSGIQSATWYVPNQIQHYYITIIIDLDDSTIEIDENNNEFAIHLTFSPDYAVANVLVDGSDANDPKMKWNATTNTLVPISVNATNLGLSGVSDAIQYNISFFNSTRKGVQLEPPFFKISLPGLLSGEDSGEIIGNWIPPNEAGEHFVAVMIDSDDAVSEKDDKNNLFVLQFMIGPDIAPNSVFVDGIEVLESPSSPIYVGPGETVNIEVNATNLGFSGTGTDFYLALYNGTRQGVMLEQPYFNVSVPALEAYGSPGDDSGTIFGFWPASMEEGLHYVIIYADISLVCGESEDINNFWVITFAVSPDLAPNNITVDGLPISSYPNEIITILPGQSILIGSNATNIGDSSTGILQFAMAYFNSTSNGTNLGLDFSYFPSLGPLAKNAFTVDVYGIWTAPYPTNPTDYYINISVDSDFDISENDESNNFYILHIVVDAPDLTPDRVVIEIYGGDIFYIYEDPFASGFVSEEISIPKDTNVTIIFDVINVGGLSQTSGANVTFYNTTGISGSPIFPPFYQTPTALILLDGKYSPSSDQTSEVGQTVVAEWTNPGVYQKWYINITIDFGNTVQEFSDSNNTFTLIINVTDFPVTTLLASDPSYSGPALYVNSTTELNLSVSGENPPYYTWYRVVNLTDDSEEKGWTNYTSEGSNITMTYGEGAFRIEFNSTDSSGNTETTRYKIVIVDEQAPKTNYSIGIPNHRFSLSHFYNITSATPITLTVLDLPEGISYAGPGIPNASGVKSTYYIIENVSSGYVIPWTMISSGTSFYLDDPAWGDGYYIIWFNSTDNLDQTEQMKSIKVYLDNNGPINMIGVGDPKQPHSIHDWYVTSVTVFTINAFETQGSGADISTIQFKITYTDGGISSGWIIGTSFTIGSHFMQGDGNYTIEYKSYDNLGNIGNQGTLTVYVDDDAPSIGTSFGVPKHREFTLDMYNITDATQINISVEDGLGSGVVLLEYNITNASSAGAWTPYTGEFNLSGFGDGLYTILIRANDALGNLAIHSIDVYLDTESPSTSISIEEPKHRSGTSHIWNITSLAPISLTVLYENGSGLDYIRYKITNSTTYDTGWQLYDMEFNLSSLLDDGLYTIHYQSVDNLGNTEDVKAITVRLDNTGPESYPNITGTKFRLNSMDRWNVSASNIYQKDASDRTGSGVSDIFHRIYNEKGGFYYSGWISGYSFSLDLPDGNYTIEFYARDNLSNAGAIDYIYLYLDSKKPESTISEGTPKYRVWPTQNWRVSKDTDFTLNGKDSFGSGLENIYYSIWNDTGVSVISASIYIQPFNLSGLGGDGEYIIRYWALDNVGNCEIWNEIRVILDSTNPTIIAVAPTGSGNSISAYIIIVFSEMVDHESVENAFSYSDGIDVYDNNNGFFNWNGRTMTYYPYENFTYGTTFTVVIDSTATDNVDNRLDGDGDGIFEGAADYYTWDFRTRQMPDDETPYIISVNPLENAQDVSLSSDITIEFSEIMNEISVELAFSYTDGSRAFDYKNGIFTWNGNTTIFTPNEPFEYETSYTVTLSTFAGDIAGNPMSGPFSWIFTTQGDTTPPSIISHSPTGDDVPVEEVITLTFDESMDKSSVEAAFIIIPYINGTFSWTDNTVEFTPVSDLRYGTDYYITMGIEAMDSIGNSLELPHQFEFTTEPDIYPPSVVSHFPSGVEVDLDVNITVTFNELMNQSSVQNSFSTIPNTQGNFSWQDTTLIFIPTILSNETVYTVTIGTDAKDEAGNSLEEPYQFTFTTKVDPFPPYVLEVEPTEENVPLDSVIRITFNEKMDQESVYGALVIDPYVAGSLSWEGNTLVFTPNGKLSENTAYTVTLLNIVQDEAGNSMEEDFTWYFITEGEEPASSELFPWDVFFLSIISLAFIAVFLWIIYETYYKKRREEEEEPEEDEEEDETEEGGEEEEGEEAEEGEEGSEVEEEGEEVEEDEEEGEEEGTEEDEEGEEEDLEL